MITPIHRRLALTAVVLLFLLGTAYGQATPQPTTAEAARPTCGIVVDLAEHEFMAPLVSLLEIELTQAPKVELLERVDVGNVLAEQELNLLFAPEGGSRRVKTGQLLRADLLICLRPGKRS